MAKVGYEDALIEYFKRPENWPKSDREDSDYCEVCGEELWHESHYHCPRCGVIVGMMGHETCDPRDIERHNRNRTEEE